MTNRANIYVQPELWMKFRIHCMQTRTTASKEIMKMIAARVGEDAAAPAAKKATRAKAA